MHAKLKHTHKHINTPETAGEGQTRTSTHHRHKQTHSFCQSFPPSMFPSTSLYAWNIFILQNWDRNIDNDYVIKGDEKKYY